MDRKAESRERRKEKENERERGMAREMSQQVSWETLIVAHSHHPRVMQPWDRLPVPDNEITFMLRSH